MFACFIFPPSSLMVPKLIISCPASRSTVFFSPRRWKATRTNIKGVSAPFRVSAQRKQVNESDVAVVWFKHDLRTDDHPGLVAASHYKTVVPLYIFDPIICSRFSDEMLELILLALEDLRKLLKNQGSDLLLWFGSAENALPKLVKEVKATHIFAEEEVEYNLRRMIDAVSESLAAAPYSWASPQLEFWRTSFYDIKNLKELPESYRDFRKLQCPLTAPVASPTLPRLDMELYRGTLPTVDDVKRYIHENGCISNERWTSVKAMSAKTSLGKGRINEVELQSDMIEGLEKSLGGKTSQTYSIVKPKQRKRPEKSAFVSRTGNLVGGGTDAVLNALAAYLRYLEGTARDDWQEMHEKLRTAESRQGASFGALFGAALSLGIVSRRRVYYEAIKYERERNAGFVSPFGYSAPTVASAADCVSSMEWYWLMALKSQRNSGEGFSIRIWRWKGYLIQYTIVGDRGPAVLLVHGFGAFLEHYRDNISGIADGGNRVWAITLLGFGKSEKPNIVYSELLWAEMLRDFIVDVIREPVHLVGNSIGGYFVAIAGGLWPSLAKSIVLINTAGSIIPHCLSVKYTDAGQTSGFTWLGTRLLLQYLRLRAGNIVKDFYPTNTARVDDWLIGEIIRASYDPGAVVVLESIFGFNLSIPLNYLLDTFGGNALIIQGTRDPLSKSNSKLSMFKEHCNQVSIREVDAGHCPHDERPEEVNSIICEWIIDSCNRLASQGFLPEDWDSLLVKYLYPSFTPTVLVFLGGTVAYGVLKYLGGEQEKGSK